MSFLGFCSGTSASENHMVHYQVPACFGFALLLKIKPRTAICFMIFFLNNKKKSVISCLTTYSVITVLTFQNFPYCALLLSFICALISQNTEYVHGCFCPFYLFFFFLALPLWLYWISRYV